MSCLLLEATQALFYHIPLIQSILGGGPLGHPKIYINLVGVATQHTCFFPPLKPFLFLYIDRTGPAWTSCLRVCNYPLLSKPFIDLNGPSCYIVIGKFLPFSHHFIDSVHLFF